MQEQVRAVLPDHGWTLTTGAGWCHAGPTGYPFQRQGWKLHVSATPLSALLVLSRCARVLVGHGHAFKFAPDLSRLLDLLDRESDRGSAGKFITVYPTRDADIAGLAGALHRETAGLPGPQILSDRQYRPGSLVHLRYGVHTEHPTLTDDGELHTRLTAPDGTRVPDRRQAWFTMPDWAEYPIRATADADADPRLAGRYRVHTAIQHANKGGVYQALDEQQQCEVIVKQARAHTGATLTGQDSQTLLRAEADALDILHPHGVCPRRIDLFTYGDSLFLVEEALTGTTLADWVIHRLVPGSRLNDGLPIQDLLPVAAQVVDVLRTVHDAGLRLGDLTPTNLMICQDGSVRCIDLEGAGRFGTPIAPIGTHGYIPPEFTTSTTEPTEPTASGVANDLYALGAVLFFLVTGAHPVLLDDDAGTREHRLAGLFALLGADGDAARALGPAVLGLMADDPAARWSLDRVRIHLLEAATPATPAAPVATLPRRRGGGPSPRELLTDLAEQLAEAATDDPGTAPRSDPRTVYRGAAGLLAVLTRIDPRSTAVDALIDRISADPPAGPVLPGLYSGVAGVAWAGFDAARLRGEDPGHALDLARRIPTSWHVPDVCHGLAGAGLAFAHLWRHGAGDEFRARVADCADSLTRMADDTEHGLLWPFPPDADTPLAGQSTYGFAHGVAGIGTFLLTAAAVTGDHRHLNLAVRAGRTLAGNVQGDDTAAWWYADPQEQQEGGHPVAAAHWCNGASGIGTFLLRLGCATDDPTWTALARRAAVTVRMEARDASACYCHGLAGNGDFLLDLAERLDDDRYRTWAGELADLIAATAVRQNGRFVIADDTRKAVTPGFATGTAGTAAFLHRLTHGGDRWWMTG
ncbi:class III lanthionine synthetase LanKC [Dactylosporangium siamense]|uniref:Serine/threonine protein kinase n=1 Tax=Dactylosporangium siamense TaxID=685454 RepID=A0A919PT25_9ACTN|nr:serine/threonine protein kinase [Dactylosporangium siamense]